MRVGSYDSKPKESSYGQNLCTFLGWRLFEHKFAALQLLIGGTRTFSLLAHPILSDTRFTTAEIMTHAYFILYTRKTSEEIKRPL